MAVSAGPNCSQVADSRFGSVVQLTGDLQRCFHVRAISYSVAVLPPTVTACRLLLRFTVVANLGCCSDYSRALYPCQHGESIFADLIHRFHHSWHVRRTGSIGTRSAHLLSSSAAALGHHAAVQHSLRRAGRSIGYESKAIIRTLCTGRPKAAESENARRQRSTCWIARTDVARFQRQAAEFVQRGGGQPVAAALLRQLALSSHPSPWAWRTQGQASAARCHRLAWTPSAAP